MKESKFVSDLKKWLNSQPKTLCWKIHGNKYQEAGIPDLVGCSHGYFFAIECKIPPNTPSELQKYQIDKIQKADGLAFILTPNDIESFKKEWQNAFNDTND